MAYNSVRSINSKFKPICGPRHYFKVHCIIHYHMFAKVKILMSDVNISIFILDEPMAVIMAPRYFSLFFYYTIPLTDTNNYFYFQCILPSSIMVERLAWSLRLRV